MIMSYIHRYINIGTAPTENKSTLSSNNKIYCHSVIAYSSDKWISLALRPRIRRRRRRQSISRYTRALKQWTVVFPLLVLCLELQAFYYWPMIYVIHYSDTNLSHFLPKNVICFSLYRNEILIFVPKKIFKIKNLLIVIIFISNFLIDFVVCFRLFFVQ